MAVNHFIKGGQTFSQNWRMFFDIFWKVFVIFLIIWFIALASLIYVKTTAYQRYQAYTLLKAEPFSWLFNDLEGRLDHLGLITTDNPEDKAKLAYQNPNGSVSHITVDQAIQRIATPAFMRELKNILFWNMLESLLISLLLTIMIARLLMQYGRVISAKKILRGGSVCQANQLKHIVKKRNKHLSALSVAGIPLPYNADKQHIWINGTTGSGKTVAFSDMMAQIRQNKQRAVVYDIMGTYVARFYRPGKDIILNPFDERFPGWQPWTECHNSIDYDMLAASQIPITPGLGSDDPFWKKSARSLYSATLRRLSEEGEISNGTLLRYLLTSDLDQLRKLLKNTEAESLVSKDLEKTSLSIKAILNDSIKGMRFLGDDESTFSIREWVRRDNDDSWVFITSRPDYHETLMPLISTWYDTAITEALSLPNDDQRRIYFPLDELPTLQYLPALSKGMPLGRQKGLCFILGTQDLAQLRINYGADGAKSLIGNANNKLILRTEGDAENVSNLFNKSEYQDNTESVSYGVTDNRHGVSISKQRHMQSIILPSELQNLDDLQGYLRLPGRYPTAKVQLKYIDYAEPNERLIPKKHHVDWLSGQSSKPDIETNSELASPADELEQKDLYQPNQSKLTQAIDKNQSDNLAAKNKQTVVQQELNNANNQTDKSIEDDHYRL